MIFNLAFRFLIFLKSAEGLEDLGFNFWFLVNFQTIIAEKRSFLQIKNFVMKFSDIDC